MPGPDLILASASPRRQQLLTEAGYAFQVDPAAIDEALSSTILPSDAARHLAEQKCKVVAAQRPDAVVLAADTVVAFGDHILGKPKDAADAKNMLRLLSATTHLVITGVCILHENAGFHRLSRVMSAVRMRVLTAGEIDRYVASGDWQGKAGGYGIQDADLFPADCPSSPPFISAHAGSRSNIVGLPMGLTKQLLSEAGIHPQKHV